MKIFSFWILLFFATGVKAQKRADTILWTGKSSAVAATITLRQAGNSNYVILNFIAADSGPSADSLSSSVADSLPKKYNLLDIRLTPATEAFSTAEISTFIKDLQEDLLPLIRKRFHVARPGDALIVVAWDEFAPVALACAASLPQAFSRTGIFLTSGSALPQLNAAADLVKAIRGKLFVYSEDALTAQGTEVLCEKIALLSSVLIYKTEGNRQAFTSEIFQEFLGWINDEGSNYIIKQD